MADSPRFLVNASEVQLLAEARFPAAELPVAVAVSARDIVLVSTRRFVRAELAPVAALDAAGSAAS